MNMNMNNNIINKLLFITFLFNGVLDSLTTYIFINMTYDDHGYSFEGNPLMREVMYEVGLIPTLLINMIVIGIVVVIFKKVYDFSNDHNIRFLKWLTIIEIVVLSIFGVLLVAWNSYGITTLL